ncbi:hypothetical protein ACTQ5F_06445 [Jeotgalibaca porci]|uniref:hypothetical protein n=1 Tax=Jeotgalibaca porci TaxID=1868793 RepID=UPI003F9304AE
MKLEWNRTAFIILFIMITTALGSFAYGQLYFITPLKEQTDVTESLVEEQKTLLEAYPPNESLLKETKANYDATQPFLPEGEKVNADVVALENAAGKHNVTITSFSRSSEPEAIEGMDARYRASVYQVTLTSATPDNMIKLLEELSSMARVWNIQAFHFEKDTQEAYSGSFSVTFYSHDATE